MPKENATDSTVEHITDRIRSAEIAVSPWPHVVIRDFLPESMYEEFLGLAKRTEMDQEDGKRRYHFVADDFSPVIAALSSWDVAKALEDKLGFYGFPWPRLVEDSPDYSYSIHSDVATKAGTVQLYLTDRQVFGYGTLLHEGKAHYTREIPFAPNVAFAFKRTSSSFHSTGRVGRHVRRSLLVPFMHEDRRQDAEGS